MTRKYVASMLGPGSNFHDLGRHMLEEPVRMAEGDTGLVGLDLPDPYEWFAAYEGWDAPAPPAAPPPADGVGPGGRTAAQTAGQKYLNDAEMEWYRSLPTATKLAAEGGRPRITPPSVGNAGLAAPAPGGYNPSAVATLYDAARQAGFTGDGLHRAVASALAESGGNFGAQKNDAIENSVSAWQINLNAHADKVPGATMEEKAAWLKDPYNAAKIAFLVSSGGSDWNPWSVWHDTVKLADGTVIQVGRPAERIYQQLLSGEPAMMAEGASAFAGLDLPDPYLAYEAPEGYFDAPSPPAGLTPVSTSVAPASPPQAPRQVAPAQTIFTMGTALPPDILQYLLGQGYTWNAETGELTAPAGFSGSMEDFRVGLQNAAKALGYADAPAGPSEAELAMDAMEQYEVGMQPQPMAAAPPTAAEQFMQNIRVRTTAPIMELIGDPTQSPQLPGQAELDAYAAANPPSPEWMQNIELERTQLNQANLEEQFLVDQQNAGQQGYEIDNQAPPGSLRQINIQTGNDQDVFGAIASKVAPEVAKGIEWLSEQPVFFNPLDPAARRGNDDAVMTVGEIYKYLDMPAEQGAKLAEDKIGGAPGRIVGEAIRFGLAPETIAGIALGGTGVLANVLGRGDITLAQYLAMSAAAGAASQGAEEAGGGWELQALAALAGGVGSIGLLKGQTAAQAFKDAGLNTRVTARSLTRAPASMTDEVFEAEMRRALGLADNVTGEALDDAVINRVARELPEVVGTRKSLLEVPLNSPEAALLGDVGKTVVPRGVPTSSLLENPAPFGIRQGGGAPTFADLPAGDFDTPLMPRGAIPRPSTPMETKLDETVEQFRGEDGLLHMTPDDIAKLWDDVNRRGKTTKQYPGKGQPGRPVFSIDDMRYAMEKGLPQGEWYARWGKQVNDLADTWGMDRNFVRTVFGITSQQATPKTNLINTIKLMGMINDLTEGGTKPLQDGALFRSLTDRGGMFVDGVQAAKITEAWRGGEVEVPSGVKTPSYWGNLEAGARGGYSPWLTGDTMHGKFFGFDTSAGGNLKGKGDPGKGGAGGLFVTRIGQHMAAELGIAPDVGQASMWAVMKSMSDNPISDDLAARFNVKKSLKKVLDEDGNPVRDQLDNILYEDSYDETYSTLLQDGKITFPEAVDDAFSKTGNDLEEILRADEVWAAVDEVQASADRWGVGMPPSMGEARLVHTGQAATPSTSTYNLDVSPGRAAELTADVEARSPVVFAATRPGSAEGDLAFWREQQERALRYMDFDPETSTFKDLASIRVPHRVEVGGVGAWGGSAEPNLRVYLPGGNMDTANWVAAHLGQKMDAFGDLMHQEGFGIEIPGGPPRFRALEFDTPAMDDAFFGRAMDAAGAEGIGVQTKTGTPNVLQFVDYDDNPVDFEASVKRVIAALQGDETKIRQAQVSSELVEAGEGSVNYASILEKLDARFDPNGTARSSRTHAESLREVFAKEEAASRARSGAGTGEAPSVRGDVPEDIPDVAGGGFGDNDPTVGGGAFGAEPKKWLAREGEVTRADGVHVDPDYAKPVGKMGLGDRGWIAPDGTMFAATAPDVPHRDHLTLLTPDSFGVLQDAFKQGWARVAFDGMPGMKSVIVEADFSNPAVASAVKRFVATTGQGDPEVRIFLDLAGPPVKGSWSGTAMDFRRQGMHLPGEAEPWAAKPGIGGGAFGRGGDPVLRNASESMGPSVAKITVAPPADPTVPGSPNMNPANTFNANPSPQTASTPVPPTGAPPGGGAGASAAAPTPPPTHALGQAPRGNAGMMEFIKLTEAAVEGGLKPGQERNVFTRALGTVLPAVDMPRQVNVGLNAHNGAIAANYQYYGMRQVDAAKAMTKAWDAAPAPRLRDTGRPEGLIDYMLSPTAYQNVAPEVRAAKDNWGKVMLEDLDHARSQFDVDIDPWHPVDPDGVYVPKMLTEDAMKAQSVGGRGGGTTMGKVGIQKDRATEAIDFIDDSVEGDLLKLADRHANQLASATGRSTFKQVVGGLSKDEVFDKLADEGLPQFKKLRSLKDSVHNNVVNLRKIRDNYRKEAEFSTRVAKSRGGQVEALESRMAGIQERVDEIMQQGDPYGPGLSHYSGQLYELALDLRKAKAVEMRQGSRAAAAGMRATGYERLLTQAIDEFHDLVVTARNLPTPGYVLDPTTTRYMPVEQARAIKGVMANSFDHAFADGVLNFLEEARIVQLGAGDLSPLTVNQGMLGMASSPWTMAKMLVDHPARLASAAFAGDDVMWRSVDQAHLRTYQALQGYSVMRGGGAPELRQAGRGLEHLASATKHGTAVGRAVGRTVRKSNDVASRLTEYGRFKAWEDWVSVLTKMNPNEAPEVLQAGALKALNEVVPALNLAQSGYGGLRGRLARAPLTSLSFALAPGVMAKDMVAGMVQLGKATATLNGPVGAWQSLLPRQQAAILMGTSLLSTVGVISAASAAAFGDGEDSMGKRVLQAIQPIDFDKDGGLKFNGDFFKFTVPGGGTVPIGGPFRSAFSLAVNTALHPAVAASNKALGTKLKVSESANPAAPLDFLETRLAGPLGTFWSLAWNNDWKNEKIREGDFLSQLQDSLLYGLENVNLVTGVPFEALRTGERGGLKDMGTDLGASFAGLNWQPPTETYAETMNTISQDIFGRDYAELYPNEKRDIREDPRYAEATKDFDASPLSDVFAREERDWEAVSEKGAKWMEAHQVELEDGRKVPLLPAKEVDRMLKAGEISGADARAYYQAGREALREHSAHLRDNADVQAELASIGAKRTTDPKKMTEAERATADYYAIFDKPGMTKADGTFNYDMYEAELAKFEKKYGEGTKAKISPSAIPLSPGEANYREDSSFIASTGWFDAYDNGFEMAKTSKTYGAKLAGFETYQDFEAAVAAEGAAKGWNQKQIEDAQFELENKYGITKAINITQAQVLQQGGDPLVDAILRWGYALNTGELRVLKELQGTPSQFANLPPGGPSPVSTPAPVVPTRPIFSPNAVLDPSQVVDMRPILLPPEQIQWEQRYEDGSGIVILSDGRRARFDPDTSIAVPIP